MATIGERIRMLREEAGIRQAELGKMVGLSDAAIGDYENGRAEPRIEKIRIMAALFNTTLDYITGHSDDRRTLDTQITDIAGERRDIREIVEALVKRKALRLIYGSLSQIPDSDLEILLRVAQAMGRKPDADPPVEGR